jgi:hypothetical protein
MRPRVKQISGLVEGGDDVDGLARKLAKIDNILEGELAEAPPILQELNRAIDS